MALGEGCLKGGERTADLHDDGNGPIGKGNLPMLGGWILTVISLTRHPGVHQTGV